MDVHVYRGTSRGWPGNPVLRSIPRTPTSRDPVVATLFSVHSDWFSDEGIIQIAPREKLLPLERPANVLKDLEQERAFGLTPEEFGTYVTHMIDVDTALAALARMGVDLPQRIVTPTELSRALHDSPRLPPERILEFDALVLPAMT